MGLRTNIGERLWIGLKRPSKPVAPTKLVAHGNCRDNCAALHTIWHERTQIKDA